MLWAQIAILVLYSMSIGVNLSSGKKILPTLIAVGVILVLIYFAGGFSHVIPAF
jgi:hypothetical protein